MSKYYPQITAALALAGILLTGILTNHHYDANYQSSLMELVCGDSSDSGCNTVNRSDLSELGGLPTAVWGLFFYLLLFVSLVGYSFSRSNFLLQAGFLMAAAGLVFDLFLFAVMVFTLETFCPMCFLTYLITAGITVLLYLQIKSQKLGFIPDFTHLIQSNVPLALFLGVGVLTVLTTGSLVNVVAQGAKEHAGFGSPEHHLDQARKGFFNYYRNAPQAYFEKTSAPQKGALNGVVVITEFADYLCPHCKFAQEELKIILSRYPDQATVVYRHYPLDNTCNKSLSRQIHAGACELSYAAQCAYEQNRFWDMNAMIFEKQEYWAQMGVTAEAIDDMAKSIPLNMSSFHACMKADRTKEAILADINEAQRLGITGTPAVYFNGKMIQRDLAYKFFDELIMINSQLNR